ncbi:hypothetical protein [Ulvibacterium sp.]|uniref:hypothetical protein n=1 Tax=Ulvibacterium sp. TaxID=2665914 RepID=UPI003BAC7B4F
MKIASPIVFCLGMNLEIIGSFPHHTPDFLTDESGFLLDIKTLGKMSIDYFDN